MKKFLGILAIAGTLVACDNTAGSEARTKDSLDSVAKAQKEVVNESADKSKDSIEQTKDAQKEMVDSMNKGTDTTNKMN
jgi:hypothetical protein